MNRRAHAPTLPARRTRLVAWCVLLLLGGTCLGLHLLLHHGDDPGDHGCAVCVQLAANPAAPAAAPELPAGRPADLLPAAPSAHAGAPAANPTRPRAPPPA